MNDALIIICTRPESSRLPGKVFMPVAGVMAIDHILHRLLGCGIPVIIAVPRNCRDYDELVIRYQKTAPNLNLNIFYGDPESPLHRMQQCAEACGKPEWIIRVTHDDILIDQHTMLTLLNACRTESQCGYGISPGIVDGAGVEVIHRSNLQLAAKTRIEPTEFVSYFVKNAPYRSIVEIRPREEICRPYRLTMDYYEDWLVLDTVLSQTGPFAKLDAVCHFLDVNGHITNWNRQPTVTFYTCVRNGEKYIRQAMQSVLNNHSVDLEYIVVDDGSMDNTAVIVSEFAHDKRVRFIKNYDSMGLASASNLAISKARGEYILRVDADDILLPHATEIMIHEIESTGAGAVYAAYHETNAESQIINWGINPRQVHHAGCALFDHKMLNEIRFTHGLRHFDGADLHKRMAARNMPIAYVDIPLWLYRRHNGNHSNSDTSARAQVREDLGIGAATATSIVPEAKPA